jgi:DNA-binding PadR family transcriptional regulator
MPQVRLTSFVTRSDVRLEVLEELSKGPKTPTELATFHREHVSHVCRALAELKAQGLVEPALRASTRRYYRVTQKGLELSNTIAHSPK